MEDQQAAETWVIVAAAGESRRMGLPDGESKQFLRLGGETILSHSVERLLAMDCVAGIVVVLHPSHTVRFSNELTLFDDTKPLLVAEGGTTRSDSVRAGLELVPDGAAAIAVHDGARPLFSKHVFEHCLEALGARRRRRAGSRGERHAQARRRRRRGGGYRRPRRPVGGADPAGVPRRRPARRVQAHRPQRRHGRRDAARARRATRSRSSRPPRPTSRSPLPQTCRSPARCSPGRSRQTYRVGGGYDAHRFADGARPRPLRGRHRPRARPRRPLGRGRRRARAHGRTARRRGSGRHRRAVPRHRPRLRGRVQHSCCSSAWWPGSPTPAGASRTPT